MKRIAIAFAIVGGVTCLYVVWRELASSNPRLMELGNLVVPTLTLIVLVWYAYDTNAIARATNERWSREGVLATSYSISMPGASVGDAGRTEFQLSNSSSLVVRAVVNLNLKVYGQPVSAGALYDGSETWLIYPNQVSQGVFEVDRLLRQQGKNVETMRAEVTEENRKRQLVMRLELTFTDEFGVSRVLPPRPHYF